LTLRALRARALRDMPPRRGSTDGQVALLRTGTSCADSFRELLLDVAGQLVQRACRGEVLAAEDDGLAAVGGEGDAGVEGDLGPERHAGGRGEPARAVRREQQCTVAAALADVGRHVRD